MIRGIYNRSDVLVVTDCGAIDHMIHANFYAKNAVDAAAKSFNGGTDIDMGDVYYPPIANGGTGSLSAAIAQGLVTEARVDESIRRIFLKRFKAGLFDPVEQQPYTAIAPAVINSTVHRKVNYDIAGQTFVLLENAQGVLPLKTGKKIAVLGPHATSQHDLFSGYAADEFCYKSGFSCVPTIGG